MEYLVVNGACGLWEWNSGSAKTSGHCDGGFIRWLFYRSFEKQIPNESPCSAANRRVTVSVRATLIFLFVFLMATTFDCAAVTRLPHQCSRTHSEQYCHFQSGLRTAWHSNFQLGFPVITPFVSLPLPPSVRHRSVPQRLPQLGEWRSGRRLGGVAAVHPSPIYLTFGGDAGPPASLPAGPAASALQAHHAEPRPSLLTDWDQEEGLQTGAHEAQHQVSRPIAPTTRDQIETLVERVDSTWSLKLPGKGLNFNMLWMYFNTKVHQSS